MFTSRLILEEPLEKRNVGEEVSSGHSVNDRCLATRNKKEIIKIQ